MNKIIRILLVFSLLIYLFSVKLDYHSQAMTLTWIVYLTSTLFPKR